MTWLRCVLGVALLLIALLDLLWTALAAGSGAGPLTGRVGRRLWQVALALHRRHRSHAVLSVTGVGVAVSLLVMWIVLTFAGWALIFTSTPGAVRHAQDGHTADLVERLYFTGYTVFTLGNGELRPGGGVWQLAAVVATGTGLVLVTMGITYLVPVASAVAQRRQLARHLHALGHDAHQMLLRAWTGSDFDGLSQHLTSIVPMLHSSTQQHLAYPVLHYFHSVEMSSAIGPKAVQLSDALDLLRFGVRPEVRPPDGVLLVVADSVEELIEILATTPSASEQDPRPQPELEPLEHAGIPTVDDSVWRRHEQQHRHRRQRRATVLVDDGWTQEQVP